MAMRSAAAVPPGGTVTFVAMRGGMGHPVWRASASIDRADATGLRFRCPLQPESKRGNHE
ncbi:hypothetical protein GCM10022224_070970 [Nonomuraea antimicrobica]|uniref:Uncharacterized protein n=1 Tax=Nonomuraea antimicrobica TaxID=561173 RepID=A0ABP7CRE0_9ACTN